MANCRNTQQLNITCGTDVVLHDKLMFDGEVFDPNVSVDIECNLVNSLGKRTSLEYEIADEVLIIQIPWVDGRNAGCYGLEVKGKCNGKTWATYADSLIRYTRATVEGAAVVETEHDWYDVTQVVSYRYSDSPLDEVDATIDDNYGEPTVTPTYEHNKLTLDFKNLRGNGIASVEQTTESTEPEGVNEITITQDNGNTIVIRVRNGKSIVGPQGIPGEGAIWTGQGEEIMTLEQKLGQAINKAMSQKAVTDSINVLKEVLGVTSTHHATDFTDGTRLVSSVTGEISTTSSADRYANEINISVDTYEVKYPCRSFSGDYGYAFVKDNGTFVSGAKDTANDYRTIGRSEILTAIGNGATKLRMTIRDAPSYNIGYDIKTLDAGARLNNIEEDIEQVRSEIEDIADEINTSTYQYKTDTSGGLRIVNSTTGEISTTISGNRYANEIELDETLHEVTYYSPGFSGNYGYAFVGDNDAFISGQTISTAGYVTINASTIQTAMSNGATKLRISILENSSHTRGYTLVKVSTARRIEDIENNVASVQQRVTALEAMPRHYKVVGSPESYISELDTDGLAVFDHVADIYAAYDALVTSYPEWLTKEEDLGMDASNTYAIRHYCLRYQNPKITAGEESRDGSGTNLWSDSTYKPRRILVTMGVHPKETHSLLGGFLGIKEIIQSNEKWAMFIKSNFIIDIIPIINPWGLEQNPIVNTNVNDKNLNRTYMGSVQAENTCVINLIQALKPLGLIGVIDLHNCADNVGYFVARPTYKYYNYYAILTQQIAGLLYDTMDSIWSPHKDCYFFLWQPDSTGQLHHYADTQGLLGCTFEIATARGLQGSLLSKSILVNIINAFGTFE